MSCLTFSANPTIIWLSCQDVPPIRTCVRLARADVRQHILQFEGGQTLTQSLLLLDGLIAFPLVFDVIRGVSILIGKGHISCVKRKNISYFFLEYAISTLWHHSVKIQIKILKKTIGTKLKKLISFLQLARSIKQVCRSKG